MKITAFAFLLFMLNTSNVFASSSMECGYNGQFIKVIRVDLSKAQGQILVELTDRFAKELALENPLVFNVQNLFPASAKSLEQVNGMKISSSTESLQFIRNRPVESGGGPFFLFTNEEGQVGMPKTKLQFALSRASLYSCKYLR